MAKNSSASTGDTPGMVPTGKGHATPKRKVREAAQRRPLVATSKEDNKKRREEQRIHADRQQKALQTGDERYMPRQHAGSPRRFARDFIDARTTVGEFLLPSAVVTMIALMFIKSTTIITGFGTALLLVFGAFVVESFFVIRRLRNVASAKFGASKLPRMYGMYGLTRLMQMRRLRVPKPQVKRGEYPS
jgi:hypothetical protein